MLFKEEFKVFLTKRTVEIDDEYNLLISSKDKGSKVIPIEEITTIYMNNPTRLNNGYFLPIVETLGEVGDVLATILYVKKKQEEQFQELLDLILKSNPDIETVVSPLEEDNPITKHVRAGFNSNQSNQPKRPKNAVYCPNCDSTNIQFIGNNKKGFSVGKAVGGAALTGGVGALAGFAGKKGKKDNWHCSDCGNVFKAKTKK